MNSELYSTVVQLTRLGFPPIGETSTRAGGRPEKKTRRKMYELAVSAPQNYYRPQQHFSIYLFTPRLSQLLGLVGTSLLSVLLLMFSQFVTAAKGLFAKKDSEEEIPANADYSSDPAAIQERSDSAPSKTATMVMTTRSGRTAPVEEETSVEVNGSKVGNAKRKAESASSAKTNGESTKRRKRVSVDKQVNGDEESSSTHEEKVAAVEKPKHFRFGSEEPAPTDELVEEVPETQQNGAQSAEDSDDDEAPEAFDNSAQLLRMKEQAQKQERARQK